MSRKTPEQIADVVIDQMREDMSAFRDGTYFPNEDQWRAAMIAAVAAEREQLQGEAIQLKTAVNAYDDVAAINPDDEPGYHRRVDAALDVLEPARQLIEAMSA